MKERDLVYLSYAPNACYPTVTSTPPRGVQVNMISHTWSFDGKSYLINEMRRCDRGSRHGPIGVYDRSDDDKLARMLRDWREASKETPSIAFSD